ncbi:TRAP-type mannitol/chloroaromatic compound transport system permease small subunit [Microbacterium halimionae]|uniref:TRAP-type mannitol/chloroaromatic compound transport system permease small subunit n=1 Tax=Microbacterium halimionae TaxID=1526413 RepID=A0A7W3JPB4_9MICO|nr:large exoprotein [Microbacterium halimionae]MBA8816517.1 TRAP-type mannitol/chloroaromatic compound transport system permease small subunit [Microbacterium halimionae]NII95296.1 TRAP-type mannitol/chloroaromatic compound transport system permease small subunit [Microbacterium halimionae]
MIFSSNYDSDVNGLGILAVLVFLIPFLLILALAGYLISSFLYMRIFDKAGVQGKWRAWVPVYNYLILAKLGDLSPWWFLGALVGAGLLSGIPIVGALLYLVPLVLIVMYSWRVGLKLGKEWYYLLLFLIPGIGSLIWLAIMAFTSSRWSTALPLAPWSSSFLADNTVWDGVPPQHGGASPMPPAPGSYTPPTPPAPQS